MRVQRAFRLARRAGRIDDERRIVGSRIGRHEVGRLGGERRVVAQHAGSAGRIVADAVDGVQCRQLRAQRRDFRVAGRVGNERGRLAVREPVFERVDAEQREERHRDGAELVRGEVRDGRFGALREKDTDAVAAPQAGAHEAVREPVRGIPQVVERDAGHVALRRFVDQREASAAVRPFVADVHADVVAGRNVPREAGEQVVVAVGGGQHHSVSWVAAWCRANGLHQGFTQGNPQ